MVHKETNQKTILVNQFCCAAVVPSDEIERNRNPRTKETLGDWNSLP